MLASSPVEMVRSTVISSRSTLSISIFVVICPKNTNQMNHRSHHHQNVEDLMGASVYIESARFERLRDACL